MSDERLTERPESAAPTAQPTGFRPPTRKPGVWTREASQAVGVVIAISLVGLWFGLIPGILSGFPWAVLLPLLGLTIGGALGCLGGWLQYQRSQPTGTRVEEGDLPTATGQPTPSATRPAQPGLPSRAVTPRPRSLAPPSGLLRVRKLARHTGAVGGVAIASDARTVVTCGGEGMIVCHDLESGFGVWNFKGFEYEGGRVAFSPDGQLLAAAGLQTGGGGDNDPKATVHILEARSGKPLRCLEFRSPPFSLCWLPDSRHLLVGTTNQLRVWEVEQPAEITIIPIVTEMFGLEKAASLAVDSAGQVLLVGTVFAQNVRVLSLPTGKEILTLQGVGDTAPWFRANVVLGLAVTPDGRFALGGRIDGAARVWSVLSGEEICRFEGHTGWWGFRGITGVAWMPDGERALSCCEDGTLCLWEARTGKELKRWDHRRGIRCLALSADGKVAVTGAWEGSLRVWYLD